MWHKSSLSLLLGEVVWVAFVSVIDWAESWPSIYNSLRGSPIPALLLWIRWLEKAQDLSLQ